MLDIRGVIFDLDGTLLTSSISFTQIRKDIGCPIEEDILTFIDNIACSQQRQDAHSRVKDHELDDARKSTWIDGADDVVNVLAHHGIPMAVVTRNCRDAAALKIESNQVPIDYVIAREDAPPKPAPDALHSIAKQWQLEDSQILVVGDYKYDILAARNAKMHSALFASENVPDYAEMANFCFQQFSQLQQWLRMHIAVIQNSDNCAEVMLTNS